MRKNVIALMLILPLLFIFVLFSSGNVASLGVEIKVQSIEIKDNPDINNGTLAIDLAKISNENILTLDVEVLPKDASNSDVTFRVYNIDGDGNETEGYDVVSMVKVDKEKNRTIAKIETHSKAGSVRIVAVSNDGGFTDSIKVIVSSSKPYDFDFSMYSLTDSEKSENLLSSTDGGYISSASLMSGNYTYRTKIIPSGYSAVDLIPEEGFADISKGAGTILLPFSGKTVLSATLDGGLEGSIKKTVELTIEKPESSVGFTINGSGEANPTITVAKTDDGGEEYIFYVEGNGKPEIAGDDIVEFNQDEDVVEIEGMPGCYSVQVRFSKEHEDETSFSVSVSGKKRTVTVNFNSFAFFVTSSLSIGADRVMEILAGTPFAFYAVPTVPLSNVGYEWTIESDDSQVKDSITLEEPEGGDSGMRVLTAGEYGSFTLIVRATRRGIAMKIDPVEIEIAVIRNVSAVVLHNDLLDKVYNTLAQKPAIAGKQFDSEGQIVDKLIDLEIIGYNNAEILDVNLYDDLELTVSDRHLVTAIPMYDSAILDPKGTGEVTVTVSWKGNEAFGAQVSGSATFFMAVNATEVYTADQLTQIVDSGREVVLGGDIMLGTNADGSEMSLQARQAILDSHKLKSTYNIEYYKNLGIEDDAIVRYAMEFKNDVYGNGYFINAEYFTNEQDGSGVPLLYKGPLSFVSAQEAVSVAAQDNIAFLIRMNDVVLSNVTLLGCSDESLLNEEGQNDLSKLNNVGTTLEINGDGVQILNCRVRNGRNVVRVYGGNRNGNRYFIDSLAANNGCEGERIVVNIEGCILSQAREFILKLGANRALRANSANGGNEPGLLDQTGKPYNYQTNEYLTDSEFYRRYVMTDVTLKDSVLETSGLFTVGIESNFSGAYLSQDGSDRFEGWGGTGGTSFASVLRLSGDVRLYDWKDLNLVDSSTLIEAKVDLGELAPMAKLDIEAMIKFVKQNKSGYENIIQNYEGNEYVHGGIACYGGGKNYAQISFEDLDESLQDFARYNINIGILAESEDPILQKQGQILPGAAGTRDFRFYMYGADSANNYLKQISDSAAGTKYNGIKPVKVTV